MNCPFYGRHAVLRGPAFPIMIAQQGNQRAVITTAYSPCRMEIDGQEPDWRTCRCWRLMSSRRSGGRDDLGHGCRAQRTQSLDHQSAGMRAFLLTVPTAPSLRFQQTRAP